MFWLGATAVDLADSLLTACRQDNTYYTIRCHISLVFLGEAPPPQNAVRRRDLDLRRAWAEVWWRFRSRRRMEQNQQDESYGPSCDYQQLSEGPAGSMATHLVSLLLQAAELPAFQRSWPDKTR
eukprot:s1549_g5.t1